MAAAQAVAAMRSRGHAIPTAKASTTMRIVWPLGYELSNATT